MSIQCCDWFDFNFKSFVMECGRKHKLKFFDSFFVCLFYTSIDNFTVTVTMNILTIKWQQLIVDAFILNDKRSKVYFEYINLYLVIFNEQTNSK